MSILYYTCHVCHGGQVMLLVSLAAGEHHAQSAHHVPLGTHHSKSDKFLLKLVAFCWRGREDLNLRGAFYTPYSLSRGAPSASWVLPQVEEKYEIGGESGIRTHGWLPIAGFQDRCLQPLGHLSVSAKPTFDSQMQEVSYHIRTRFVNCELYFFQKNGASRKPAPF